MDYGMSGGNNALSSQAVDKVEGQLTGDLDVLSLGMTDEEIARAIGNRVTQSEKFWNDKLDLENRRDTTEKYYLGKNDVDLYDFQTPYQDNRLFTAIETLVALVCSRPPQPIVTQAYDAQASYELAQQLQKALLSKYEDLYIKGKLQMVARHLLIGLRLGVMKVRWDDTVGAVQEDGSRFGDIAVDALRPQRVVIDAAAQDKTDVPLIGEYRSCSLEELINRYPAKEDEILTASGKYQAGVASPLTSIEGYIETHFTTYKEGQRIEAIAWKYKTEVLESTKTPFWNYEETYQDEQGRVRQSNFLTKPTKPYVFFNYLNLGRWIIDDTSLTDQAIPLQDVHDKRGRQIVENADQGNGGWVFNTQMVKPEDAAAWVNNPGDKILANGNASEAAARFPAPALPDYVLQDKIDARNEIDNIFGTHGAIKGEVTSSKTLGQDVLSQRGDSARLNVLATSIEDGSDQLYKFMAQVMKVFYDVPQLIRYNASDTTTSFFSFGRDQIEDGAAIRVKTGSVLPEDPLAKRDETIQSLAILDPLSIAEGLGKENPKEWAKRNLLYRLMPDRYMTEILDTQLEQGAQDPSAMQHIQLLNSGESVPPELNPTKEHIGTHTAFAESPDFKTLPPEIQQLHVIHVKAEMERAKSAMGMGNERPGIPNDETGTPLQQEQTQQLGVPPETVPIEQSAIMQSQQ